MKFLKWAGVIVLSIIVILAVIVLIMNIQFNNRLDKTYEVTPEAINIPTDSASLARGQHLATVMCTSCHGGAFEGKVMIDDNVIATLYSPNLTSGKGGIGKNYTDADWVRSIRHGIRPNGKPLFIMPAKDFQNLSKRDLGNIIAFLKTVPPADKEMPKQNYHIVGKILTQTGAFGDVINAETIDHSAPFPSHPAESEAAPYGEYLVRVVGCQGCHDKDYGGMQSPEPGAPYAPNLTAGGAMGSWSHEHFIKTIRSGITPKGKELNRDFMPWPYLAKMTDLELNAVFNYLKSLPPVERQPGS